MNSLHGSTTIYPGRPPVVVPEDDVIFRLAQLLLLLAVLDRQGIQGTALERLGNYDFLTANPLLMLTDEADPDRTRLLLAGFDGRALSYASPSHRFTSRRERLQHDLALLVGYGLAAPTVNRGVLYAVTSSGKELAARLTAAYARAYRTSADIVVRRLAHLSDKRLREDIQKWITISSIPSRPGAADLLEVVDLVPNSESARYAHSGSSDPNGPQS